MNNPFKQPINIFKICFNIFYKDIDLIEEFINFYLDEILSITLLELHAKKIEALLDDLWRFEIYVDKLHDTKTLENNINNFCLKNNIFMQSKIFYEKIENIDWIANYIKDLKPINAGRFFITPLSHADLCPEKAICIIIDSSRAFGTGQHYTTQGCIEGLEYLSSLNTNFINILDLGTGSGILAIIASKIWPKANIIGCDIEEIAIEVSNNNAKLNDCYIDFYKNDTDKIALNGNFKLNYDLVISNILEKSLIDLANEIKSITKLGSYLILSGFLDYQTKNIIETFTEKNFTQIYRINKESWVILILRQTLV